MVAVFQKNAFCPQKFDPIFLHKQIHLRLIVVWYDVKLQFKHYMK